jgi:hypothetical protein
MDKGEDGATIWRGFGRKEKVPPGLKSPGIPRTKSPGLAQFKLFVDPNAGKYLPSASSQLIRVGQNRSNIIRRLGVQSSERGGRRLGRRLLWVE